MNRILRRFRPPTAVSVVINTLNRRDHLERTLVALRDQTYPRFEVIVVNGPSTDDSAEMLRSFEASARLATCAEACLGISRNIGVAMAAGDIVAFTDDDAVPGPDWLDLLVPAYDQNDVAAAGGPVFDVPLNRIEWKICTCDRLGIPNTDSAAPIDRYVGPRADPVAYLAGCNMSFRRSALQAAGGFNSLLPNCYDDVDICCRLSDAGHRIAYVEAALVRHDRASNAQRDEHQVLRDPYPLIFSRSVFSLQCGHSPHSAEQIADTMTTWANDWGTVADQHLSEGRLSADEHRRFIDRAVAGAVDGIAAGSSPRPWTQIPDPPRHLFRPYR